MVSARTSLRGETVMPRTASSICLPMRIVGLSAGHRILEHHGDTRCRGSQSCARSLSSQVGALEEDRAVHAGRRAAEEADDRAAGDTTCRSRDSPTRPKISARFDIEARRGRWRDGLSIAPPKTVTRSLMAEKRLSIIVSPSAAESRRARRR